MHPCARHVTFLDISWQKWPHLLQKCIVLVKQQQKKTKLHVRPRLLRPTATSMQTHHRLVCTELAVTLNRLVVRLTIRWAMGKLKTCWIVSWFGSIEAVLYIQGKVFRIPHSSVEEARSFCSYTWNLLSLSTSKKEEKYLLFLSLYSLWMELVGKRKGGWGIYIDPPTSSSWMLYDIYIDLPSFFALTSNSIFSSPFLSSLFWLIICFVSVFLGKWRKA